ncbi:histidine kinase [Bifidobacterium eulemuris]|nr:histidine kinase [Bifidobacterium eulemuris]
MDMTLVETPGSYYMFAYWLAALVLCVARMPRRFDWWRTAALSLAAIGVLEGWMRLTDGIPMVLYVPSVALCMAVVFGFILATCRLSAMQAGYYTVQVVMLGEFAASLEYQIYYYLITRWSVPSVRVTNVVCLVVIHAAVFSAAWLLTRRSRGSGPELRVRWNDLLTVACIGLFAYSLSNISYVLSDTPFSTTLSGELFIIRTITDFAGVAMLFVFDLQMRERNLEMEQTALRSMLQMQYNSYRISKESMELVNRKYHDLKHQIALLRTEGGDANAHLDRLEREIGAYEAAYRTGNDVLDTMLTMKAERCRALGIQLQCVAQGESLAFIDPMDLSSLFGNALDNAIEAAGRVRDADRRQIRCSVAERRGFVQICVENGCEGPVAFDKGVPRSTKGDDANHGFGFKSMREIVERYGGSITARVDDGRFILRMLIPVRSASEARRPDRVVE